MAKKKYETTIDLTWSGETRTDTFKGKNVIISSGNETYSGTVALWTDDIVSIIEYVLWGGSRGGVRKQWDTWEAWNKINDKDKQKIVKVIVFLKTGVKLESKINVDKYKITIEDINLLRKEYEKYKILVENVRVYDKYKLSVENVKVE